MPRSSSLGIVALIIDIVALLISFIPFLGILSIPLAALALLMAVMGLVISLFRSGAGIGWPIAGGVVAGLALFIGIAQVAVIGGVATAMDEAVGAAAEERQRLTEDWEPPQGFTKDQTEFHVRAQVLNGSDCVEWALRLNRRMRISLSGFEYTITMRAGSSLFVTRKIDSLLVIARASTTTGTPSSRCFLFRLAAAGFLLCLLL